MTKRFWSSVCLSSATLSFCYLFVSIKIENEFLASLLICFSGMILLGWSTYAPVVDPNELLPWFHAVMTVGVIALLGVGFRPHANMVDHAVAWIASAILIGISIQIAREWHISSEDTMSSRQSPLVHRCTVGVVLMGQSVVMAMIVYVIRGFVPG